jgi:hypothetical protein
VPISVAKRAELPSVIDGKALLGDVQTQRGGIIVICSQTDVLIIDFLFRKISFERRARKC